MVRNDVTGIGFGTWAWGNQLLWGYDPERDDPGLAETLQVAVRGGLSLVDTADSYGTGQFNGRSEALLGRILSTTDPALCTRLTVATKLAPFPWRMGRRGFDRAFAASQKRLGGHLTRVQLHWSTSRYAPWQETPLLDGLADLVAQGRVAELGVSNLGPQRLRALHGRLQARGVALSSVQVQMSLLAPDSILAGGLKATCEELDIAMLAYSPLALGVLAVKPGGAAPACTRLRAGLFRKLLPASEPLRDAMARVAVDHKASLAQVALNWCRAHGAMPLPGLRRVQQARDAVAALSWTLNDAEREELDALALAGRARMPANPFISA